MLFYTFTLSSLNHRVNYSMVRYYSIVQTLECCFPELVETTYVRSSTSCIPWDWEILTRFLSAGAFSSYSSRYSVFLIIICDTWDFLMLKISASSLYDFPPHSFSLMLQLSSSESSRLVCLLLLSAISFLSLCTVPFVISCIFKTKEFLTWAAQIILQAYLPYSLLNKKV